MSSDDAVVAIIAAAPKRHQSRYACSPGRTALIAEPTWDLDLLADLSAVMRDASICGLGQAAPNPVDCVIRYFPHELG